jgi:hypothetical protein
VNCDLKPGLTCRAGVEEVEGTPCPGCRDRPSLYNLDGQWRTVVHRICRDLGRYTYADVFTRLRNSDDGVSRRYTPRGCYIPTIRELQQYLRMSHWSVVVAQSGRLNVYEYRGGLVR